MTEIEPERQVLLLVDISIAAWVTETTKQHRIPRKALDVPTSHFSFAMPSVMENSPGTQHHLKMTNLERIVVLSDPIASFLKTREAGSSEFARVSQATDKPGQEQRACVQPNGSSKLSDVLDFRVLFLIFPVDFFAKSNRADFCCL